MELAPNQRARFINCSFWHCPKKEPNPDYGFCDSFYKKLYKTYIGTSPLNPIPPRNPKFPA